MMIAPKGWEADCDGVDGDRCFNEIKSDDYDYEDTKDINSEEEFEEFIKRLGWAVKDGEHFCPECAERMKGAANVFSSARGDAGKEERSDRRS